MGDKPISFRDADGNFVSAADVWNEKKLEELFNRLNPKRALRLAREKKTMRRLIKKKNSLSILIKNSLKFVVEVEKLIVGENKICSPPFDMSCRIK